MRYQDYLDIGTASDRASFERKLIEFGKNLDFDVVSAALVIERPGSTTLYSSIGNGPDEIINGGAETDFVLRDPVVRRLKQSSVPFVYDQAFFVNSNAGDLWEEQARFGLRTGISMALHFGGGRHFLMGVDRDRDLPADDVALTRMMADLQLLAVCAQEAAARVLVPSDVPVIEVPKLTKRELDVLRWTREDKSAWAVGQILSISEHTVIFHLRNVMTKLGVSSKHQAVLRAIELGLL